MKIVLALLSSILLFSAAALSSPPTISNIPNQVAQKNTTLGPIGFTVGDAETSVDSLYVTAVSRDTFLVPAGNIVFGGSGASRTVNLTPATNATGTVVIEIHVSDGVESALDTFLLKVNEPPHLDFNQPVTVPEGGTGTITTALLHSQDPDNSTAEVIYHAGVESLFAAHSVVRLNGVTLPWGGTFTQQDVDSNRVTVLHDGSESTSDFFSFSVTDADGGLASDAGHTAFHFNITITPVNDAPTAYDSAYSVGIGESLNGTLRAADPESSALVYSIATNGTLGTATVTDANAGSFTYVPNAGVSGIDTVFFQVFDGSLFASQPGRLVLTIANQPPLALADSATLLEGSVLTDTFHAADPDLPPQTLSFAIVSAGHLGTAVIADSNAGTFVYTPQPNIFGIDTVEFSASDGTLTSAPALFRITIRPAVDAGDIIVCDTKTKAVVLVDPVTGAQGLLSQGGSLGRPLDVVVEPSGQLMVLDGANGLVRVNPLDGSQSVLTPGSEFTTAPLGPTTLAIEQDGDFLVADGVAGVKRIDHVTGAVSVLAVGTNLNLVVGVAVDRAGNVFAGDASLLGGGTSAIVRVNPVTGAQSVVISGGNIKLPIGITVDNSGAIFLCQPNSFAGAPPDLLEKIDSATGAETIITPGDTLRIPLNVEVDANGKLLVTNNQGDNVMRIESPSGASSIVSAGGYLQEPFGLTIVRPAAQFHADKASIDFGSVNVGASAEDSIIVSNTGNALLVITSAAVDSSQFTVSPAAATIAPSASMTFHVTFTPTSGDTIDAQVIFTYDAFGSPALVALHAHGTLVGVGGTDGALPASYALHANYPNPFNPATTVSFDLPRRSTVSVKLFSLLGTEVATLVAGREYAAGYHAVILDASALASGVYFYELTAEAADGVASFRDVKKMLLVR